MYLQVTCSNTQPSLLYTRYNKLLLNTTAQEGAGLTDITCGYKYIHRVDDDHYIFLPEVTLEGHSADLSPNHNAVWARCYLNTYWAWLPEIVLYIFGVQVLKSVSCTYRIAYNIL